MRFKSFLGKLVKDGIDMTRMHSILERQKMQLLESVETDPADVLSTAVLTGKHAKMATSSCVEADASLQMPSSVPMTLPSLAPQ